MGYANRQKINLPSGWSFGLKRYHISRSVIVSGDYLTIEGAVENDGPEIGTVYITIDFREGQLPNLILFESDRDLAYTERTALKIYDIKPGKSKEFAFIWRIPPNTKSKPYDIKISVCNPHVIHRGPFPYVFDSTDWQPALEVVEPAKYSAFISYSWHSKSHKLWVGKLADALLRNDIQPILDTYELNAGDEVAVFMERGIAIPKAVIAVCSDSYTDKFNTRSTSNQKSGVGFEASMIAEQILNGDRDKTIIAVVRDNKLPDGNKVPHVLKPKLYIKMMSTNWQGKPLADLVRAIKK